MLTISSPWTTGRLRRSLAPAVLSAVLICLGWYLAAGRATLSAQLVPCYLALGGLFLYGYAALTWLAYGRRAIGQRRRRLLGDGGVRP